MCQFLLPQLRIVHPTVELLMQDPLPVLVDEICEVLGKTSVFNKVDIGALSQMLKVRLWAPVVE